MRLLTTVAFGCLLATPALADKAKPEQHGTVKETPVIKADRTVADQPIVFPQKDGEVTVTTYEFPPGAILPIHKHPFPRIGYVLAGTLSVTNEETGKTDTFTTGDVLIEATNVWHRGKNLGHTPVRMLVIDTDQKGVPQTVPKK